MTVAATTLAPESKDPQEVSGDAERALAHASRATSRGAPERRVARAADASAIGGLKETRWTHIAETQICAHDVCRWTRTPAKPVL